MGLADDLTGEAQTATKKQLEKPVYMWSTNQENYHGHKCETEWEAIMTPFAMRICSMAIPFS